MKQEDGPEPPEPSPAEIAEYEKWLEEVAKKEGDEHEPTRRQIPRSGLRDGPK
jgi:hypothetical protein